MPCLVFGRILAALTLCLVSAACSQDNFTAVAKKEDMMVAAGFRFIPANTPERQAFFRQLPPHRFLKEIKGDRLIYIYPDPTVCVCLYVGNAKAYSAYRRMMFERNLADEQALTAQSLDDFRWNWAPWAAGFPYGTPYADPIYMYQGETRPSENQNVALTAPSPTNSPRALVPGGK